MNSKQSRRKKTTWIPLITLLLHILTKKKIPTINIYIYDKIPLAFIKKKKIIRFVDKILS